MCVAFYLCQVATAIDIAIYIWSHLGRSKECEVGITHYLSYEFWFPCVVFNIIVCICTLCSTITTSKHVGSNVGAVANNNVSFFPHYRHVATAIDILKECTTINLNCRRAIEACHVFEGVDGIIIFLFCICHTISTTKYRAMEFATINGQFNVAIYLAEFLIIVRVTIVCFGSIVIISSTSTSKDAVFAIEFSTIDGYRCHGFSCLSVYVSTHFTWDSSMWPKV